MNPTKNYNKAKQNDTALSSAIIPKGLIAIKKRNKKHSGFWRLLTPDWSRAGSISSQELPVTKAQFVVRNKFTAPGFFNQYYFHYLIFCKNQTSSLIFLKDFWSDTIDYIYLKMFIVEIVQVTSANNCKQITNINFKKYAEKKGATLQVNILLFTNFLFWNVMYIFLSCTTLDKWGCNISIACVVLGWILTNQIRLLLQWRCYQFFANLWLDIKAKFT